MLKRKPCATCKNKKRTVLFFKECHVCREQWRLFYAGQTPVSPMMRAIEAEKSDKYRKRNKKNKKVNN
jgi:hypothetical protein